MEERVNVKIRNQMKSWQRVVKWEIMAFSLRF